MAKVRATGTKTVEACGKQSNEDVNMLLKYVKDIYISKIYFNLDCSF